MTPKELVKEYVEAFNNADVERLANLYADDAINHQVVNEPIQGKETIKKMLKYEFIQTKMVCIVEKIFGDGEWIVLEWREPLGFRGCEVFQVVNGKIKIQRGYWDKLSFYKEHGLGDPRE